MARRDDDSDDDIPPVPRKRRREAEPSRATSWLWVALAVAAVPILLCCAGGVITTIGARQIAATPSAGEIDGVAERMANDKRPSPKGRSVGATITVNQLSDAMAQWRQNRTSPMPFGNQVIRVVGQVWEVDRHGTIQVRSLEGIEPFYVVVPNKRDDPRVTALKRGDHIAIIGSQPADDPNSSRGILFGSELEIGAECPY